MSHGEGGAESARRIGEDIEETVRKVHVLWGAELLPRVTRESRVLAPSAQAAAAGSGCGQPFRKNFAPESMYDSNFDSVGLGMQEQPLENL